jgi:hypothetical protein
VRMKTRWLTYMTYGSMAVSPLQSLQSLRASAKIA